MNEFISGSKLMFYLERLETKNPITLEVFLTDYCDNTCPYCRYKHGQDYISYTKFIEIFSVAKKSGIKGVILTGGGEPMLNPDFEIIAKFLENVEIPYGVNTYLPKKFPKLKSKWLKISYHNDRVLDRYEEFLEDVPDDVFVSIQKVYLKPGDLLEFVDKIKHIKRWNAIIVRPLEHPSFQYSDEALQSLKKELEQVDDERVVLNYKWKFLNKRFKKCYANWSVLTVDAKGRVIYCCHKPDEVVGNITDSNILKKKERYQIDMSKCEVPCRLSGPNYFLEEEIKNLPLHLEFI
jgi:organic radical activating enzyme